MEKKEAGEERGRYTGDGGFLVHRYPWWAFPLALAKNRGERKGENQSPTEKKFLR